MSGEKITNIIEAAIMVAGQPLSVSKIMGLFEAEQSLQPTREEVRAAIRVLQDEYNGHGVELIEVASGFRFQARDEYADWVNHLFDERPPRYSRALLETLAIIAYRQPLTRGEIEDIRGVSVSSTIVKTLQERDWIKVIGHRDVPGKPELLATTKTFLDYFNLKKLSDLPDLADIKDFDSINPDLFEELEGGQNTNNDNEDSSIKGVEDEASEGSDNTDERDNAPDEEMTQIATDLADNETTFSEEDDSDEDEQSAKVIPFSN